MTKIKNVNDLERTIDEVIKNPNIVASLYESEISLCLKKVDQLLSKEKALIEPKGPISFVGDTHGDFQTTKAIVQRYLDSSCLVFLGDYIDREPMKWGSIYNITYLLFLKCRYPEKIFLLKGNHESNYAISCFPYEFEQEIIQRYNSLKLHEEYVKIFSSMPLMALANNIFAAHGGIMQGFNLKQLKELDKNNIQAIESIIWSDPTVSLTNRGIGDSFNEENLIKFLDEINARIFVRGHDYDTLGYSIFQDRCITIFSSQRYKNMGNGGILVATANKNISSIDDLIIEDYSRGKWMDYELKRM